MALRNFLFGISVFLLFETCSNNRLITRLEPLIAVCDTCKFWKDYVQFEKNLGSVKVAISGEEAMSLFLINLNEGFPDFLEFIKPDTSLHKEYYELETENEQLENAYNNYDELLKTGEISYGESPIPYERSTCIVFRREINGLTSFIAYLTAAKDTMPNRQMNERTYTIMGTSKNL